MIPSIEREEWSWFLNNRIVGISDVTHFHIHAQRYIPQNQLLICPRCGEIWGRIFRPSADMWGINSRICEKCGIGFFLPYDPQWINIAPPFILRREVLLISELPNPDTYDIHLIFRNTL